jgi:uncharacterized membrane protein YgcG
VYAFVKGWQDPSDEQDEAAMRQRERMDSIVSVVMEWMLAVLVIFVVLGVVAIIRRPNLHVTPTDMAGKVVIITDSCSGRGLLHAQTLAQWKADVIVTCANKTEAESTALGIAMSSENDKVRGMRLDLRSLASVRTFAQDFMKSHKQLHVLVNSADARVSDSTSGNFLLTHDSIDSVVQARAISYNILVCRGLTGTLNASVCVSECVCVSLSKRRSTIFRTLC